MKYVLSLIIILAFCFIGFSKVGELVLKDEVASVESTSQTNSVINYGDINFNDSFKNIFSNNEALFAEVAEFMLKKEGFVVVNNLDLSKVTVNNRPHLAEDIFSITELELLKKVFNCMSVIPSFDSLVISKKNEESSSWVNGEHIVFNVRNHLGLDYYDYGVMYCDDALVPQGGKVTKIKDNWWYFNFFLV